MMIDETIRQYLVRHGAMSGRDICDDLGVTEIDVEWALDAGYIQRAGIPHCGSGPWYRAR